MRFQAIRSESLLEYRRLGFRFSIVLAGWDRAPHAASAVTTGAGPVKNRFASLGWLCRAQAFGMTRKRYQKERGPAASAGPASVM